MACSNYKYGKQNFTFLDAHRAYWKMLERDGHLEELTALEESRFYGVNIIHRAPDLTVFAFRALPQMPIHVKREEGKAVPYIHVRNMEWRLSRIYLKLSGLFPSLDSIDFECASGETNKVFTAVLGKHGALDWTN